MKQLIKKDPFDGDILSDDTAESFYDDTTESFYEEEYDYEQPDSYSESPTLNEILESESDQGLLGEVNRKSRTYIKWVQRSLNKIMGTGLKVDGIAGRLTRRAVRNFQRSYGGLAVDGIVGPKTEKALIAAGASMPPGYPHAPIPAPGYPSPVPPTAPGVPTLYDLDLFSKDFVRRIRAAGRRLDCADLAIELWIRFGQQFRIPVSFRIWHSRERRYKIHKSHHFRSTDTFVKYVQGNLGALGLIRNTYAIPGGHRASIAGDVFLWQYHKYHNQRKGKRHRWGHTQVIYEVIRGSSINKDKIKIAQGNLPPIVPVLRIFPSAYFYTPRRQNLEGVPHIGSLVGNGPRRFRSFRNLRYARVYREMPIQMSEGVVEEMVL